MSKSFRAVLLIAAGLGSTAAAPPEPRQPTARWVVNCDNAQCVASRNYGSAQDPLFMVLKAPPLGNVIQIGVIRPGKGPAEAQQLDGEIVFDQRTPLRTSMLSFTNKKTKQRAYLINLPIDEFVPARTATVISVRAKRELDERFATSDIEPLMKVIDDCVADLRKVWNVTEGDGVAPNLKEAATGNLQGVLKSEDYPAVALKKYQSGTVTLALLIDETGKVADCTVIGTSGAASLDTQSCGMLKDRAKFKPAIGLDGKPAKGSFIQRITWRVG
jgi:TonB family protein